MPVLRQITSCTGPSTIVVERASRARGRALDYRLETCVRHRWLAQRWVGRRSTPGVTGGRCGTVLDYRDYDQVVQSHSTEWIRPLTAEGPEDHGGDVAAALRAAHDWLLEGEGPGGLSHVKAVRAALGHAARIAESMASGGLDAASGQAQVLMALSVAETLDAFGRGA